jgi:predicted dehydrogenase
MDVVRIGTLGSARISEVSLVEAARQVPEVTVTAVGARDQARAEAFALRHGIPVAYGSYDDLLADPDIDAIYNPLPNSLHAPWTLQAITAGKHVLCEKPFASNEAEAKLVADAVAASELVVMEAMHYRYHPLIERLTEVVATLGPVRRIQAWTSFVIQDPGDIRYDYALGGGALMDGGCYALDCLRLLGGTPEVTAAVADTTGDGPVDIALAARLSFPGGAAGWFESAFTRDGDFRADVHVTCENGTAWVRNFILAHDGELMVTRNGNTVTDDSWRSGTELTTYAWQLRAFAAAITAGAPVATPAAEAVTTMRLIDDAYRKAGLPPR